MICSSITGITYVKLILSFQVNFLLNPTQKAYLWKFPGFPGSFQTTSKYLQILWLGQLNLISYNFYTKLDYVNAQLLIWLFFIYEVGTYPLSCPSFSASSMLSIPLYDIPRTYPSGLDKVTETNPLPTTNWKKQSIVTVKLKPSACFTHLINRWFLFYFIYNFF